MNEVTKAAIAAQALPGRLLAGYDATPWGRGALLADPDRTHELGIRAHELGAGISVGGKTSAGPWTVRVGRGARVLTFRGRDLHDVIAFGLERWAAGADDTGFAWRAGADALEHAHPARGRVVWTLCKQQAVPENYVHPGRSRCRKCWIALDRDVRVAAAS